MAQNQGNVIEVQLASNYTMVLWIVGFCTLGIGALAMMMETNCWPKRLDDEGMTLRNGKKLRWNDIEGATAVTVVDQFGNRVTGRLELKAGKDKAKVVTQSIEPAQQVIEFIRMKLGDDKITTG